MYYYLFQVLALPAVYAEEIENLRQRKIPEHSTEFRNLLRSQKGLTEALAQLEQQAQCIFEHYSF